MTDLEAVPATMTDRDLCAPGHLTLLANLLGRVDLRTPLHYSVTG